MRRQVRPEGLAHHEAQVGAYGLKREGAQCLRPDCVCHVELLQDATRAHAVHEHLLAQPTQ